MQFKPREHPDARARKLNALAESVSSSGDAATHAAAAQASAQAAAASLVLVQAAQTSASDAATQAQSSAVLAQAGAQAAADSVDAAEIHAQNAEFAKQLADQARADAQGAFDAADAAKLAALQAANDSATSAASALGSATSAAGQATIVEQRASEVELFASSATAAANIAALKSDAANANAVASSVSSTSAQVSATDAGISAAAAYQSELNAAVSSGQSGASADAAALSAASAAASQTAAGNSASAAQTSATNAATSANNANTSASQASTSATQASTSASNAASSEAAAATSATNAANSATAAGGSATAAANSASSAATSSSAAQSAATSATSSANTASTQAANASSSASAAATSASSASSSSTAAGSSAAAAEASKIAAESANTNAQSAASASSSSAASASASAATASTQASLSATHASAARDSMLATVPDNFNDPAAWLNWGNWGGTFAVSGGVGVTTNGGSFYSVATQPIAAGRRYRLTMRHRVTNVSAGTTYIGVIALPYNSTLWFYTAASGPVGTWQTSSVEFTADEVLATYTDATAVRLGGLLGYPNLANGEVSLFRIEDITSEYGAITQAGIANSQRVLAESARAAAESASSLSATYRDQAQGHANSASSSASAASSSAASASSSASTATSQASLSSTFAGQARLSASETVPSDFSQDGKFFAFLTGTEAAASQPEQYMPSIAYVDTPNGRAMRFGVNGAQGSYTHVAVRKRVPLAGNAGRRFRTTARVRMNAMPSTGANVVAQMSIYGLTADYNTIVYGGHVTDVANTPGLGGQGRVIYPAEVGQVMAIGVDWSVPATISPDGNGNTAAFAVPSMYFVATDIGIVGQPELLSLKHEDITEEYRATSQANIATTQATSASASAASAAASAVLSASIGQGLINRNPGFDDYPSGAVGALPTNWNLDGPNANNFYRVSDPQGGYAMRCPGPAGYASYIANDMRGAKCVEGGSWYVWELDWILNSGSNEGVGSHLVITDANYTALFSYNLSAQAEVGLGSVGKTYSIRKLQQLATIGVPHGFYIYAMAHWSGLGSIAAANDITFLRCGIRPATAAEIRDQTVLAPMEATVSSHSSAIATLDTRTASYLTKVSAGAGTAELAMVATDSGGSPASSITLKADKIRLGSLTQPALEIVGGVSTFNGELNVGGSSGARVNITKDLIRVFDASGVLRVRLGIW